MLRGVVLAIMLQGVVRVVTAHSEHLFYDRASVPRSSQPGFEETLGFAPVCMPDGKKNWKTDKNQEW